MLSFPQTHRLARNAQWPLIFYYGQHPCSEERIRPSVTKQSLHLILSNTMNGIGKKVWVFSHKEKMPVLRNYYKIIEKIFPLFLRMARPSPVSESAFVS